MHEIYYPATIRRHIVRTNECVVIQNQLIITPLRTPSFRTRSRIKRIWHLMKLKKISRLYSLRFYVHNLHRAMWRQFAEVPDTLYTALLILNYYVHVSSLPFPDVRTYFFSFRWKFFHSSHPFCSRSSRAFVSIATCNEKSDSFKEQTPSSSRIPTSSVVSMVTYAYPCSVSLDAVIKLTGMQAKELLNKRRTVHIT